MIALSIFHIIFILVAAFLVLKVYRLVKFKDIGILMSITSVLLSLTSKKQICSLHFEYSNADLADKFHLLLSCRRHKHIEDD